MLEHLFNYWAYEYTGVITDNAEMKKLDPGGRLLATMKMIKDYKLAKYGLSMNAWAKIDPIVNKVVKKVVKMRLDYIGC